MEKRDAWPGNDAFLPNVQPVAARAGTGSQDLCVSAPAMSTGSHGDVLDKTAQVHPERCNTNQKLTEQAQTHLLATSNLLQGEGFNEDTLRRNPSF